MMCLLIPVSNMNELIKLSFLSIKRTHGSVLGIMMLQFMPQIAVLSAFEER